MHYLKTFTNVPYEVYSTYQILEGNRCGSNDGEIVDDMGYNSYQVKVFNARVKTLKKSIEDNGYQYSSVVKVCSINCVDYIIDGQGRIAALKELHNEGKDVNIPVVLYFESNSIREVIDDTRLNASYTRMWSKDDKLHAFITLEGDQELLMAKSYVDNFIDKYGVSEAVAWDFIFGQGSRKESKLLSHKVDNAWPYIDIFEDFFDEVIEVLSTNHNISKRGERTILCSGSMHGLRFIFNKLLDESKTDSLIRFKNAYLKWIRSIESDRDLLLLRTGGGSVKDGALSIINSMENKRCIKKTNMADMRLMMDILN